jgi:hypothetical protein
MNGPKVKKVALVKLNHMRETPQQPFGTRQVFAPLSKNPTDTGTIRRKGPSYDDGNPQRLYVQGSAMNLDAGWVTGFVDGEGCFHIGIATHAEMTAGFQVLPEFTVVQHERDVKVLHGLKALFGCGVVRKNHGDRMAYRVRKLEHLRERIVPFFMQHPLKTGKRQDFEKFRTVLLMMERGEHLNATGIAKIREIAAQMNRGRPR